MATVAKTSAVLKAVQLENDIDIPLPEGVLYTIAKAGDWCLWSEERGFHSFVSAEDMSDKYLVLTG